MKNLIGFLAIVLVGLICSCAHRSTSGQPVSYYKVPLVCGAAPEIGCGSRIKPFFIETGKQDKIKESWSNRKGTIIAIVWADNFTDEDQREELIQPLFGKQNIEAELIRDEKEITELGKSMEKDKWYKGMDVDQLSIEEAGVIASRMITFAKSKGFINNQEADSIKPLIENYFKAELVKVREPDSPGSQNTREKWKTELSALVSKYIIAEKANEIADAYVKYRDEEKTKQAACSKENKKDCCKRPEKSVTSEITCPNCGYKRTETLPTEICQLTYTCGNCKTVLHPKEGDCCVFCSYGDHKCPSKQ
jgi:hypothetical protein